MSAEETDARWREIDLGHGRKALVDQDDYERVGHLKWHAGKCRTKEYVQRHMPRAAGKPRGMLKLHRVVMNAPAGVQVDHINGDTLDCRKSNLRIVTHLENAANRGPNKGRGDIPKGAVWHKRLQKWQAAIRVRGKRMHLGYFDTPEEAGRAYDEVAAVEFGEFARLNYPTNGGTSRG